MKIKRYEQRKKRLANKQLHKIVKFRDYSEIRVIIFSLKINSL